jgi:type IV pilus assembly protein PilB
VAATLQSNLSGLARALVQKGRLAEREAEALQAQANAAGVGFIEQLISAKKMREMEIAEFASQTFGIPLLDLALFDQDFLPKVCEANSAISISRIFLAEISCSMNPTPAALA